MQKFTTIGRDVSPCNKNRYSELNIYILRMAGTHTAVNLISNHTAVWWVTNAPAIQDAYPPYGKQLSWRGQLSLLPSAGREMSSSYGYGVKA